MWGKLPMSGTHFTRSLRASPSAPTQTRSYPTSTTATT
nr:MAG TPA: hypothetical protein [Caudoviricetes sp.]